MILTSENINGDYYTINIPTYSNPFAFDLVSRRRISITWGADNIDNESAFFPSNAKVEFFTLDNLLPYLYDKTVSINVYENSLLKFSGLIDIEDINFTFSQNIYKLTFVDRASQLKLLNYSDVEWGGQYDEIVYVEEMLSAILSQIGYTIELVGTNSIQAVTDYTFGESLYIAPFHYFGTHPEYFFDGTYPTLWDILVNILSSFGLIGFFYGTKFIIQPRFFGDTTTITPAKLAQYPEVTFVSEYDYIEYSIRTGSVGIRVTNIIDNRIDPTKDPLKRITYNFEVPGGEHPPAGSIVSFTNLYAYVPEYVAGLGNGYWSTIINGVKINGSSPLSCWRAVANNVTSVISNVRRKLKANIFDTSFKLFDNVTVFGVRYKIISLKQDIGAEKTSITGLEY